ncbi:hypothetical protein PoB_001547300 [Plakobranchus ocellatus]|uniref:Uncharacterized protein n=1 Tax=Plakobranchus ocellatus TaxID=259542 RepID=A0AAV3Z2G1_9GAST|nr:hypothetical protein PoB_001547300 [Plakobranchus ocellatus]
MYLEKLPGSGGSSCRAVGYQSEARGSNPSPGQVDFSMLLCAHPAVKWLPPNLITAEPILPQQSSTGIPSGQACSANTRGHPVARITMHAKEEERSRGNEKAIPSLCRKFEPATNALGVIEAPESSRSFCLRGCIEHLYLKITRSVSSFPAMHVSLSM